MQEKVADASVIAALAFGEPRSEEARRSLRDAILYEPLLLGYELASVARKKILQHPEAKQAIQEALALVLALDLRWVEADHPAILSLALETGLTTYDAAYLHLARQLCVPLLSFDERLLAAANRM